jgi:hypothetical protein
MHQHTKLHANIHEYHSLCIYLQRTNCCSYLVSNGIKESLSAQLVIATGIPVVRSGVRIQAGGKTYLNPSRGEGHFYLLRSFLFNGYRFFFTGDIKFTTHLYLVAGLRVSGAILLILLYALMAWIGTWPLYLHRCIWKT